MSMLTASRAASTLAAVTLAASPLLVPTQAQAASLVCRASVSDSSPSQYSNVYVRVGTGRPDATVLTVAHYATTNTVKRGRSNRTGKATVTYYISGATPGRRVVVDVTVTKGRKTRTCSTSFTPHR
jgi:hypothetical protein